MMAGRMNEGCVLTTSRGKPDSLGDALVPIPLFVVLIRVCGSVSSLAG